jgi:thioesterase domain-containing protein
MMTGAADVERFLHEKIPLTAAMGVRVAECTDARMVLVAPLGPNHNHLGTAFGGSLHTMATLSGYSLLWWLLREPTAHIVVRESTMLYERPVQEDIRAVCKAPAAKELARMRENLARKGKARIELEAVIEGAEGVAAKFRGVFVVFAS